MKITLNNCFKLSKLKNLFTIIELRLLDKKFFTTTQIKNTDLYTYFIKKYNKDIY